MADLDKLVDELDGLAGDIVAAAHPPTMTEALQRAVDGALDNSAARLITWVLVAQKLT